MIFITAEIDIKFSYFTLSRYRGHMERKSNQKFTGYYKTMGQHLEN